MTLSELIQAATEYQLVLDFCSNVIVYENKYTHIREELYVGVNPSEEDWVYGLEIAIGRARSFNED